MTDDTLSHLSPTIWEALIGAGVSLMAYIGKKKDERLQEAEDDMEALGEELKIHRIHCATNMYTKTEVNEMVRETRDTVRRIHERLDELAK